MEHTAALLAKYFPASTAELHLGGAPASVLAEKYGTPLFVYDAGVADRKWALLRNALPRSFSIFYSVKANPSRAFLEHFLAKGCGLEVASAGEFQQALAAGCPPERILFAGPGKTEEELHQVLERGIGEIHAESLREIRRISAISLGLGVRAPVAVRVNPGAEAQGGAMRMGGKPAPFGIDEEELDHALDCVLSDMSIDFRGVHLFTGTQILDHTVLLEQYRKGLEIARRAATRLGRPLHTVDFGGGLGISYFPHEQELDMEAFAKGLAALMGEIHADPLFFGTGFVVEPGRYLVGEAGVYLTRINDIKVSRGKKFLVVDGGMNHHLAASGNLGQTIKRNYPIALVNRLAAPAEEIVDVVGPLCTPLDVLGRAVNLPAAEVGDLVGVFQSGAYARSASPLGFLSHPAPPEVWVNVGEDRLVRRRGQMEDYLGDQCVGAVTP